jgi:hypothetical protein
MWQWMGVIALDIANEKSREAQAAADRWWLMHANDELASPEPRQALPRRMAAGVLRRLSDASISIGEAACEAATRLDHRTA